MNIKHGREILIPVTFREFDGGFDAQIQEVWLEHLKKQTYKNFKLIVTSFREKHVKAAIEKSGLPHVFYQSSRDCLWSMSDMFENTFKHLEKGKHIILWTTSDHMFDTNFFAEIAQNTKPNLGGTCFPHLQYASLEDWHKNIMTDEYYDTVIHSMYDYDPNLHLPEVFYLDGDMFLNTKARELMAKYPVHGLFPGIGLSLYICTSAQRLENLCYKTNLYKITNNKKIKQPSKANPEQFKANWHVIEKFCLELGVSKNLIYGTKLFSRKWLMHFKYKPLGTLAQRFRYFLYFMHYALCPRRTFILSKLFHGIKRRALGQVNQSEY